MQTVADLTLNALDCSGATGLHKYAKALRFACSVNPPPFGMDWYGDKYRTVASDPQWLAQSLVANAEKEGEGSRKLWELASRTADAHTGEHVRLHAIDESRHALMYISMLHKAFPDACDDTATKQLRMLSPNYDRNDRPPCNPSKDKELVLDELIQMNIGEIRTRIHQLLLRPMITSLADPTGLPTVDRILDALLRDETAHILYTAKLIEKHATNGLESFIVHTMNQRFSDFNTLTLEEVGESRFVGE